MPQRMIDLVRRGAVPDTVLKIASRGGLSLSQSENIEILVHLAGVPQTALAARETLSAIPTDALADALRDENCGREVLAYFLHGQNRRDELLPILVEHRGVPPAVLAGLLESATRRELELLLAMEKIQSSPELLEIAQRNPAFPRSSDIDESATPADGDATADTAEQTFVAEHKEEISAEEKAAKPFAIISEKGGTVTAEQAQEEVEPERLSLLQRLARMTVGERVKTAMRGN